ncbi:hypothetical protein RCL1_003958 [Eukaryota sp. TZLM3-RCL]
MSLLEDTIPLNTPQYLRWIESRTLAACEKLADRDTKDSAADSFAFIASKLTPASLPLFISSLSSVPPNSPASCYRVQVEALQHVFELHPAYFSPDVTLKSLSILLKRLLDGDEQTTNSVKLAVLSLVKSIIVPNLSSSDDSWSLSMILRPIFTSLSDGNRVLQEGAAECLCSCFKAAGVEHLLPILDKLISKLTKQFKTPTLFAKSQLCTCFKILFSICGEHVSPFLPSIISCLVSALHDRSWKVRYCSIDALGVLPESVGSVVSGHCDEVCSILKLLKSDKIKGVRELATSVLIAFETIKSSSSTIDSHHRLLSQSFHRSPSPSNDFFPSPNQSDSSMIDELSFSQLTSKSESRVKNLERDVVMISARTRQLETDLPFLTNDLRKRLTLMETKMSKTSNQSRDELDIDSLIEQRVNSILESRVESVVDLLSQKFESEILSLKADYDNQILSLKRSQCQCSQSDFNQSINDLKAQFTRVTSEINQNFDSNFQQLSSVVSDLESITPTQEDIKNAINPIRNKLENQNEQLKIDLIEVKNSINQISSLGKLIDGVTADVEVLKSQVVELGTLKDDVSGIQESFGELYDSISTHTVKIEQSMTSLADISRKVNEQSSSINSLQPDFSAISRKVNEQSSSINSLQSDFSAITSNLSSNSSKIFDLQKEIALLSDLKEVPGEIFELKGVISDLQSKLLHTFDLKSELTSVSDDLTAIYEEISEKTKTLSNLIDEETVKNEAQNSHISERFDKITCDFETKLNNLTEILESRVEETVELFEQHDHEDQLATIRSKLENLQSITNTQSKIDGQSSELFRASISARLNSTVESVEALQSTVLSMRAELAQVDVISSKINQFISSQSKMIDDVSLQIAQNSRDVVNVTALIEPINNDISELQSNLIENGEKIEEFSKRLTQIELINNDISELQSNLIENGEKIEEFSKKLSQVPVINSEVKQIQRALTTFVENTSSTLEAVQKESSKAIKLAFKSEQSLESIRILPSQTESLLTSIDQVTRTAQNSERSYSELATVLREVDESLRGRISRLSERISILEASINSEYSHSLKVLETLLTKDQKKL